MKRSLFVAIALAMAIVGYMVMFGSEFAQAQATRTWVSGVGDDVNPCSRTAPCKTFAGAISKTAANGEISVLDPGGFGAVTITKSITINGEGTLAGILSAGVNGVIVNGSGIKVTLKYLSINGAGTGINGIKFLQGDSLSVEHVSISGFTGAGVLVGGSGSAGINRVLLRDVVSENNNGGGALFSPATTAYTGNVEGSTFFKNTFGLRAESNASIAVNASVATGNTNNGFVAITTGASPATLNLTDSVASYNTNGTNNAAGIQSNQTAGGTATVRMTNVSSVGNNIGLLTNGGGAIVSFKNNMVAGNAPTDGVPTSSVNPV